VDGESVSHYDRPDPSELVQAVREFLERDVMAATEGRVQFHTRVAVNALGMVERELQRGPLADLKDAERAAERALATQIRRGALDDRLDAVRAEIRATVREKLLVANPGYLPESERA
jgi:hypothetical protein